MKIPCFLVIGKCRKFLVWNQLIPRLIGMATGLTIALYFQSITLEFLITQKFTAFSIVLGVIVGTILGHTLNCYFEKRKRKI